MNKEYLAKKKNVDALINEKNIMSTRLTEAENDIDNLQADVSNLQTDVSDLNDEKNMMSSRLTKAENTLNSVKTTVETAETKATEALARNIFTDEEKAKLAGITNPMTIKGRVDTESDLPTVAEIGWFYFVGLESASSYKEYCYSETGWEYIGLSQDGIDLSNYYTKAQVDSKEQTLIGDIQGNVAAIEILHKDVGDSVAGIYSEITSVKNTISPLQDNVDALINEKNIMSTRLTKAETNINNINSTVAEIKTLAETTESNVDKLNISAGSVTKPIYLENGTPKECSYTLGEASSRGVDTTPTNLSNDLITSGAVYKAVTKLNEKTDATNTVVGDLSDSLQSATDSISELQEDINSNIAYGICVSEAATTKKEVTLYNNPNWKLKNGSIVSVRFINAVPANSTLSVNGAAAKSIHYKGSAITDGVIKEGDTATFVYNTQFHLIAFDKLFVDGANKLTTDAGSSIKPVYFQDGIPKECSHTLGNAASRDVDTTPTNLSNDLITSGAVYKAVTKLNEKTDATNSAVGNLSNSLQSAYNKINSLKNDIALNRTTLGTQCKNLLKNTSVTKTVNGVTFTVNDDKSITVSGKSTSSSTTFYNVCKTGELTLENDKSYIMTGCPENNKSSDNNTLCYLRADSSAGVIASDTGNGVTFTTSESLSPTYAIICVSANADFTDNPVTFYPMIRYADILDDTYEPYQPSLVERCLLKDTAGINLGHAQSSSITIDNLSAYTALWVNVSGGVSGINFQTNLIVPIAYLAKSSSNIVPLAGGIPSSAYITSEGALAAKDMNGTITAKVSGNTLDLTISDGIIGSVEVISLM